MPQGLARGTPFGGPAVNHRAAAPLPDADGLFRIDPLEFACGWVPGRLPTPPAAGDDQPPRTDPIAALEDTLRPALGRPPCVVGFSGGRDSSLILAVALRLARREGLPEPIAATKIHPGFPETDESDWQELVIRHLGVTEWVRQSFDDELDLLAPAARDSLREHGLLWPATCHNRGPHLALARGGSYVGGEGGDELLGEFRPTAWARVLAGIDRRPRRVLRHTLSTFGPRPVRRELLTRDLDPSTRRTWLRPHVAAWFDDVWLDDELDAAMTFPRAVAAQLRRRAVVVALGNLHAISRHLGVHSVQPLATPAFATSWGHAAGTFGYPDRTTAMHALAADLLPDAVLSRESKAGFNRVYAGVHTRAFIDSWDGSGLDEELVDVEALREQWQQPVIHGGTFQLLHQAWLAGNP